MQHLRRRDRGSARPRSTFGPKSPLAPVRGRPAVGDGPGRGGNFRASRASIPTEPAAPRARRGIYSPPEATSSRDRARPSRSRRADLGRRRCRGTERRRRRGNDRPRRRVGRDRRRRTRLTTSRRRTTSTRTTTISTSPSSTEKAASRGPCRECARRTRPTRPSCASSRRSGHAAVRGPPGVTRTSPWR